MTDIEIKTADTNDAKSISRLEQLCFSHSWSEASVKSAMESGTVYFCAENDGCTVGYAGVKVVLDEGQVANIAVDPSFRGRHIGRALAEKMIDHCKDSGCTCLTLEVRPSNQPAVRLYESLGFCSVGVRKNYYRDPLENCVLMTLFLDGEHNV